MLRIFKKITLLALWTSLSFSVCSKDKNLDPHTALVLEIYDLMQAHVLTKEQIDWQTLKQDTLGLLGNTPTLQNRDQAIFHLVKASKTNHTFFRNHQTGKVIFYSDLKCKSEISDTRADKDIPEDIGYLSVPGFVGGDRQKSNIFSRSLQSQIKQQDNAELKGWIIDLTSNSGGNMWPMLAGLTPILGNNSLGQFVTTDGSVTTWGAYNGRLLRNNTNTIYSVDSYKLKSKDLPIAVLTSKRTASSGEASLIALKALPNTRTFGENSCGQSTANKSYQLSTGDALILTVSVMADKHGNPYGSSIHADVSTLEPIQQAVEWIYSHSTRHE